jgi:hypothetical protein
MLGRCILHKRRGLEDGCHDGTGRGIGLLSGVNGARAESKGVLVGGDAQEIGLMRVGGCKDARSGRK